MLPTLERCAAVPKRTTTQHHTPLVPPHRQTSSAKPPNQRVGNGSSSSSSSGGGDDDDETHALVSHFCLRSSLLSPRPPVLVMSHAAAGRHHDGTTDGHVRSRICAQAGTPSVYRLPARPPHMPPVSPVVRHGATFQKPGRALHRTRPRERRSLSGPGPGLAA